MVPLLGLFFAMANMPIHSMPMPAARVPQASQPSIMAPASSPELPCPPIGPSTRLLDPPDLYAKNGVLEVTLTLVQNPGLVPVLCWTHPEVRNGKIVQSSIPPTLNLRQGEALSLTLVNTLSPPNPNSPTPPPLRIDRDPSGQSMDMPMGKHDPYALMCDQPQLAPTPTPDPVTGRIYGYHRGPWNEANLHFHGLNTSPKQPSDDVVNVLLCPSISQTAPHPSSYHYLVKIPRDEPPGAYWYHPHAHGESLYQVFQGLTGALIIHSIKPSIPDKLPNHVAIIRDSPAHQGIIKYPRTGGAPLMGAANIKDIRSQLMAGLQPDYTDRFQKEDHCPGKKAPFNLTNLSVNGLPDPLNGNSLQGLPASKINVGETQYWYLFNTDAQTSLNIIMLVNGKQEPIMVTARDGVPLVVKNGRPTYQAVPMDHVFLTPAGRIEFYVTGATPGAEIVFRSLQINTGCVGDVDLARNLFAVQTSNKQVVQHISVPPSDDPVPQRFSDLAFQHIARKRTFLFTEYLRPDEPEPDFYITEVSNPKAVEHPYRMTGPPDTVVKDGTVEEWTIINYTNEIHGFHIHQIHFMPIAGVGIGEGLGQMDDTVLVTHGGWDGNGHFIPHAVKLLMDFRAKDIVGTFVYHCHFLEHEDNGMMARIKVVP